jgi:sugar phosphate isomerase/epimerase
MYKNLSLRALGHSLPFDEECELANRFGFAGVELDLDYLMTVGSPEVAADWFAETGLLAGGFALATPWRESDSESSFTEALDQLTSSAQYAEAVGCKRCFTQVPPSSETLDFYQHFDLVVPRLIRAAEILAAHGIMLGFEFVGLPNMRSAQHKDFIHSLDGARSFAAAIGMHSLNTGVLLDSFHWHTSGGTLREIEHLDHHEVVYTYLNDAVTERSIDEQIDTEREMVGTTGVIDIDGFLGALQRIGYVGPLTVKPNTVAIRFMSPADAAAAASEALDEVLNRRFR